ncbi:hypothetical protein RI129_012580 [Pyrocoelia pectoralis]|uniref:CHK kinase-like domain-containing protein n=1 Tax=Pyrocoelia pectoralis TaxID=417401 RepID=A0AAN7Z653_9COLE
MKSVSSAPMVDSFLEDFLKEMGITNYTIEAHHATRPGENFVSNLFRLTINGKNRQNAHVLLNLIKKIAPNNEKIRAVFPLRAMYERETYYYTTIFPEMIQLQKDYKVKEIFNVFPKVYKTSSEDLNETLLLQDMCELGYKQWDPLKVLDTEHAFLVARSYGKLHALSFALRLLKPTVFKYLELNTPDHIFAVLQMTEDRKKGYKQRADQVLSCLDENEDRIAYETFNEFSERMLDAMKNVVKLERVGKHAVLTHSDCWINNYLFDYKESSPTGICILDWQLARCGSPALDLSYFLFCCTSQGFRKEHYRALIAEYYDSFSEFLAQFGIVSTEVFPLGALEDHLRRFSVYGLFMAILTLNLTLLQGKEVPSFQSSKSEKDIFKLREAHDSSDFELYRSRIRGVVVDFVNLGFEM